MGRDRPTYELVIDGVPVKCADAHAAVQLIRAYNERAHGPKPRRPHGRGGAAKRALLDGQYRTALSVLVSNPDGVFADELVAKCGFEQTPKSLSGFMTGFRRQLRAAGLPDDALTRERRKNGAGWKNHFQLSDKAAETLRGWLEGR